MLSTPDPAVHFSVIVPARNEAKHIQRCLDTLLAQDYPGQFEIIVVDGLSEDGTAEIVQKYAQKTSSVRLVTNPRRITSAAFNLGIRAARGRVLLTVGAHWFLPADYLSQISQAFARHPEVQCLGGRINRVVETDTGKAIEAARGSILGGGLSERTRATEERLVEKANIAYIWHRQVFEKVGLFDEYIVKNQDNDFNLRCLKAGFKTLYSPRVVFNYNAPGTFRKLGDQLFGYASYIPMLQVKHRRPLYAKHAMPLTGLLLWLSLAVLSIWNIVSWLIPAGLLGGYLLLVGLTAAVVARRSSTNWWAVLRAFGVTHVATSLGFLRGLLRLMNLRLVLLLWRGVTHPTV